MAATSYAWRKAAALLIVGVLEKPAKITNEFRAPVHDPLMPSGVEQEYAVPLREAMRQCTIL